MTYNEVGTIIDDYQKINHVSNLKFIIFYYTVNNYLYTCSEKIKVMLDVKGIWRHDPIIITIRVIYWWRNEPQIKSNTIKTMKEC